MNDKTNMKLNALICLFIICSYYKVLSRPAQLNITSRETANDDVFPYMVAIRANEGCFVCGGSIISKRWILSAAHCIEEEYVRQSGTYSIVYGTNQLYSCSTQDKDPDTLINVKTVYIHPKWNMNSAGLPSHDVVLLELEEDIPFSENVQPVSLPDDNFDAPIGQLGTLTGWGSTKEGDDPVDRLQKIELAVLENTVCSFQINGYSVGVEFDGTQFLCTDDDNNRGQCSGDSGGPYVINGVQYGIVSWSIKPCGKHPGVFSRVAPSEHRRWIRNMTGV